MSAFPDATHVHTRQIPYLVHFTPITNLSFIVKDGLRSRKALKGQDFVFTDENRIDGWPDWISVSISFINYQMFWSKRNFLRDVDGWAIVVIRREALWELDCRFFHTNAASSAIRKFGVEEWSTAQAFERMFDDAERRIKIPDCYTTDPQAEVMIRHSVPREYIREIAVEKKRDAIKLGQLSEIPIESKLQLFRPRRDFEQWQRPKLNDSSIENPLGIPF